MKVIRVVIAALLVVSMQVFAAPLVNQWMGTGMDADKRFCEYGDGEIIVISAAQNCPLYN